MGGHGDGIHFRPAMKKPQVLVLIDWYKPFYKAGGPVRSMVNMVEHLHDRIDFHIVTGDRDYMADHRSEEIRTDGWISGENGERIWYASKEKRTLRNWFNLLASGDHDVIYCNGLFSRWSTIIPLWILRGSQQRRIVAVRGMLAKGPMSQRPLKKRLFIFIMKMIGCFKGVEFQATNQEEIGDIKRWIGKDALIHHVPNLSRKRTASIVPIHKSAGGLRLISPARIAEEKGTLLAIERLRNLRGNVTLDLYGTVYDAAYWQRCEKAIASLPANVKVTLHGQLDNEEVMGTIARSHVLYMPSTGENFGHAMFEALSVGRPLLISDRTPWRHLEGHKAGWDLPLEDPDRFADILQKAIDMDDREFQQLVLGSFAFSRRYLADIKAMEKCLEMFMK